MIARLLLGFSSLILILSVSSAAVCQESKASLPSAEDVIEQHLLAIGGFEFLGGISSIHVAWETVEPGKNWRYEVWQIPGRQFIEMSVSGVVDHYDGVWLAESRGDWSKLRGVSWRQNMNNGVTTLRDGDALQSQLIGACVMAGNLQWRDRFKSVRCVGVVEIDAVKCYHLKYLGHDDAEMHRYFSIETGYLRRQKQIDYRMNGVVVTRNYADHQRFDGVVIPKTQSFSTNKQTVVWKLTTFEYDEEVDVDLFIIPDVVQVAIDKLNSQSEGEEEPPGRSSHR